MLLEAEAIPYTPSRLIGERLLVLAPHPDDEVIGCGGVLAQHLAERRTVRVVIATDGGAATADADPVAYRDTREAETRAGLAILGPEVTVEFLRHADRQLESAAIRPRLEELLREYRPDLILVPSLVEIHPDHVALGRALCELLQERRELAATIAVATIAFYEVGNPLRPNALVDITAVADAKYAAIAAHASQMEIRDYVAFPRGLNAFRAMSLGPDTKFAEAYWTVSPAHLATIPLSDLRRQMGMPPDIEVTRETVPLSVVVRTKNRPALLAEALASIHATGYPAEVVVVNDGGTMPSTASDVRVVNHEQSRGRSEAMNSGVKAATSEFIAFLDDDDLFYPEHLQTLANATRANSHAAWYTDAVSAFLRPGAEGRFEAHKKLRLFAQDYDADLLLLDNYIPLPTLLVRRSDYLDAGGFDPSFDLFEDWDFLIRLSRRGTFLRIPRVTCEVRHFESGDSIVLSAAEGTPAFRAAKLQVWKKHAGLVTPDAIASAFELQKRRANEVFSGQIDAIGRAASLDREVARYDREKQDLIRQLGAVHQVVEIRDGLIKEAEESIVKVNDALADVRAELVESQERLTESHEAIQAKNSELRAAVAEIARLQGLLDMIFASRTWKTHMLLEKLKGRG
jgi:LmbE family N-acetylglucosaminyl deacetylase